ncbi:MAG: hypothetical protein EOR97_17335 [Mesorhizobium sp.]|uniref:hypothetical protein n=1 Tax=Mesorhizobium sp. TaxID=1871066 RepID=UPI000FE4DED9|nr:hypothetical protein [Mesorhizobium sp.]RWN30135.1 MAG: hypothetical protein EOR97_17335 [Mesorhizobium sp.]
MAKSVVSDEEIQRAAEGDALFIFALQVKSRLSPETELDDSLSDEGMARAMIDAALASGVDEFKNELWGTARFVDRRFDGTPASLRSLATDRVKTVIGEQKRKHKG